MLFILIFFVDTNTSTTKEESEKVELETFKQLYKPKLEGDKETYKKIPKFYFKLPRPEDVLAQKLREETRAQFLQKKSKELLDNSELKFLWSLLEKSNGSYSMANSDELTVDYLQFKKIREEAGPKYRYNYIFNFYFISVGFSLNASFNLYYYTRLYYKILLKYLLNNGFS